MAEQNFDELLASMSNEWNKAEKAIKIAENINGEVVIPAIFELRYAGRRLIEALAVRESNPDEAFSLLRDAKFDCHRARHDAIDAATSKMSGDLSVAVEHLTPRLLMKNFSEFTAFYGDLFAVRDKIAVSREDRMNRDAIYDTIQSVDLSNLSKLYFRFRACEPLMVAAAEQEAADADETRQSAERSIWWGKVGVWVGVIGIVVAICTAIYSQR